MDLVRHQALGNSKLMEVLENSDKFGFTEEDILMINKEIIRTHHLGPNSFIVYSTTDGQ